MCNVVCCSYTADILLTADRLLAADTLLTAEILHLTSVTVAEDALRCLVVRPGMAFQPDGHDSWFLCLANLRWCFLGWPFSAVGDDGLLQPFFMHKMDQYQCTCVNPVMNPGSQTIQLELGDVELPLRCFLRFFSGDLVQHQLVFLAEIHGHAVSQTKARVALLELLALEVGDQEFADSVVKSDPICKKKVAAGAQDDGRDERDVQDELAEIILETMDREELSDFKDILKRVSSKEKTKKKVKWQKLFEQHMVQWQSINMFRSQWVSVFGPVSSQFVEVVFVMLFKPRFWICGCVCV